MRKLKQHQSLTVLVYSLAAVGASLFWVTGQQEECLAGALLGWLLFFGPPLLFVFSYPRFLFAAFPPQTSRLHYSSIFHGFAASITTVLFVIFGSPFWKNPVHHTDSILLQAIPIVVLPMFFVAALSLLVKNRSTLARFASLLFWPYWLLLALMLVGQFFEATIIRTAFCFLCFLSSILFAFAAGGISHRPVIAHSSALAGLVSLPWIYWTKLQDTPLGNIWTDFNVPDREFLMYKPIAELTIFSVALMVLAIATAALRLLPVRWNLRGLPLCERSWPAFAVSLLFVAVWFSQSVMPYRISGALDFGSFTVLQILHVEKRGLQFHETCINVWGGYQNQPESVSFSRNDRRLFQYRFQQTSASGELPGPLKVRIQAILNSSGHETRHRDTVKPLRAWNEEGWYFNALGVGLRAFTTGNGTTPPQEIVDLFNELRKIPHSRETQSDVKDVCLGFCYDPLSGLGFLYANHRCVYDGHAYVCR